MVVLSLLGIVFELVCVKIGVGLDLLTHIIQLIQDGYKLVSNLACLFSLRLRVLCRVGITPISSLSDNSSHPVSILHPHILLLLHAKHHLALLLQICYNRCIFLTDCKFLTILPAAIIVCLNIDVSTSCRCRIMLSLSLEYVRCIGKVVIAGSVEIIAPLEWILFFETDQSCRVKHFLHRVSLCWSYTDATSVWFWRCSIIRV